MLGSYRSSEGSVTYARVLSELGLGNLSLRSYRSWGSVTYARVLSELGLGNLCSGPIGGCLQGSDLGLTYALVLSELGLGNLRFGSYRS